MNARKKHRIKKYRNFVGMGVWMDIEKNVGNTSMDRFNRSIKHAVSPKEIE